MLNTFAFVVKADINSTLNNYTCLSTVEYLNYFWLTSFFPQTSLIMNASDTEMHLNANS